MQDNNSSKVTNEGDNMYVKKIKMLIRLFGDSINKEELQQKIARHNGDIELIIEDLVQQSIEKEVLHVFLLSGVGHSIFNTKKEQIRSRKQSQRIEEYRAGNNKVIFLFIYLFHSFLNNTQKGEQREEANESDNKSKSVQKEVEKTEIGETKPGINLQGYCSNDTCLASKAKLLVWVNIGFDNITFVSDKTSFSCPDCKRSTVTSIVKAMFYNSEYSIGASGDLASIKDNNYQCSYTIKSGLSYELKANKIRQHAMNIENLRERSEHAMNSIEIKNLVTELQRYEITVVKPPSLKGNERLLEKIQADYGGDFNQAFDIGRFTILCDNPTKLQTAVAVIKKAEQFNLIVSEDKDFFGKQSKTHHRFHNIKLYVPKHDVYIEMQATLKSFTTLEGYTVIENPKLSHLFYEHIRAWEPNNPSEDELKQSSDETLTKINDVICEWIDTKEIKKIASRYKPHSEIRILKPPQLKVIHEEETNAKNDITLKLIKFVYDQLCKFNPKEMKGKAIHVILFEYFKKHIIGEMNPASCADVVLIMEKARKQELEEDVTMLQALETYISLQANNYSYTDNDDNEKNDSYDCHQHIIDLLREENEEKKSEQRKQAKVMILQGKSGSGKSLFGRHLEESLWELCTNGSSASIPVYISLPKCYNELNEKHIISQALQMKQINKEIIDVIRENISFVFILDGFDEIFDKYDKNNDNERYFYNRFNLSEWNAKIIVSCRSHVLNDEDIKQVLIGPNNTTITSMTYLWPFSKEQMNGYINKFVKMNKKNKVNDNLDWTVRQYEETLKNYPNLNKMMEEPFLLRMILTVLPSLMKKHSAGTKISKAQVYEAFNEQWIDIHVENISKKLSELRIQTNPKKAKLAFQQYCQNLGFEMFIQGNQVATEDDYKEDDRIWSKLDPIIETDIKNTDEKLELQINGDNTSVINTQDIWEEYFNGDSIAKYVLRRVGNNKYQFLHKSCQEYYAAQKIIFDILSWKPNIIGIVDINNQQFQQHFETHVQHLSINFKLLNEELEIIHFIAERIHDLNPIFINLKSRLFRIVESSKDNKNVSIAAANAITILNSANINMDYQNWNNIKIPYAILDRAFLEGTNFSNANLDNVSFYQTCLTKVNFTNASMNGIYFGEYAYLEGHTDYISGIQFSPDWTKIISFSGDKTIRIWDASSGKQLHVLEGHTDIIKAVEFSHDGSKILSCSYDKTVRVWDVLSGQEIPILKGYSDGILAAQFSPDDSMIVFCSNGTIRIWDIASKEQTQLLQGHPVWTNKAQFSSDGSKIVSCSSDKSIRIWDLSSGKQLLSLEGHSNTVIAAQFISNGSKIISYSSDKSIRVWDAHLGQQLQILEGHTDDINGIQLSSDESKVLSYSEDKTIRIWDLSSGNSIQVLEGHSVTVNSARFSPDSSRVVSGSSDSTIRIWDTSTGKQLQILEGHSQTVNGVEFFPNESKILSCSEDKTIRIWDIALERKIQLAEGHLNILTGVKFSPDGSKIGSCSVDKTVRLWDVQSGKQIQVFMGHSDIVVGLLFSADGSKIVSYSDDKTIRIWDVASGRQLHLLEGHSDWVKKVQFSPDGSKLVSCSIDDNIILLWDISSGRKIQEFEGHSDGVNGVQFSSDGSKIVSCSYDRTVRLWDVLSGRQLQIFEGHTNMVEGAQFSLDGSKIISCSWDRTIRMWNVASGKQLLLFEGHGDMVSEVQFSPDDTKIVSSSYDKTIRLWDILSGKQIQIFEEHSDHIQGIQFSPDGSKIISYSQDKTIRIWDVSSGKQIQLLEGHIGGIYGAQLSPDGSKLVSCSMDKTIRLWGSDNGKIVDVTETDVVDYIWKAGIQSGLSMKGSIWKNTKDLTPQQKLLVEQRGGIL
ncbi:WD-40 repeat-containing protein [Reticulomyxa filosa]|uniref:WD-40 repeat-containing protein n=1 Tax=Reticulomyxa filosa TaxID=46433 RepID=X6NBH1_RETFI|nr:WD-40 repeat-containing protein [Reticulomyxa filosa]|eukprot:ETO22667.1 WD-40 repeat-containing protein [Reticulomyxa filosa]